MRSLVYILLLAATAYFVFYFSWLPDPDLSLQWFMPAWLGNWTNAHSTFRTSVPMFLMGLISGLWLLSYNKKWRIWMYVWICLIAIVTLAELGQLILPNRVFDWRDIVWGALGALGGLGVPAFAKIVSGQFLSNN